MAATKLLAIMAGSTLAVGAGVGGYQLATGGNAGTEEGRASASSALSASATCGDIETALDEIDVRDLLGDRQVDGEMTLVASIDDLRAAATGAGGGEAVVLAGSLTADEASAAMRSTATMPDPETPHVDTATVERDDVDATTEPVTDTTAEVDVDDKRPHTDQVEDARIRMACTDLLVDGATLHVTTTSLTTDPDPSRSPAIGERGAEAEVGTEEAGATTGAEVDDEGVDASAEEERTGTSADAEADADADVDGPSDVEPTEVEPTDPDVA